MTAERTLPGLLEARKIAFKTTDGINLEFPDYEIIKAIDRAIADARQSETGGDNRELAIQSLAKTIADLRSASLTSTVSQAIFNALCPGVRQTTEDRTNYKEAACMAIAAVDNHRDHFQQDAILTEREACAEIADSYRRAGRQMVAANSIAYAIRKRSALSPNVSAPARERAISDEMVNAALASWYPGEWPDDPIFDKDGFRERSLKDMRTTLEAALHSSAGTFDEGEPSQVYTGTSDALINEIGLMFNDAMSVKCNPSDYARRCISLVRAHDAQQPNPDVEAMAAEHSRLLDHFETWARDHSADATAETWAIIYCSRTALATYRASREQENTR